jgi:NAD+ synthase
MTRLLLEHIVNIDYMLVEKMLSDFLKVYLVESRAKGFVIGLSGGLDSSTALALAIRSVDPKKIVALIMPDKDTTPDEDVKDAIELAEELKVEYQVIEISNIVDIFKKSIPIYRDNEDNRIPLGNLRARIRMCILYYYANKLNYLVLGTSDRSEYLIGYFTKYGDGGVDLAPLLTLYKTQVKEFAKHLGIPQKIINKPSAPRLWKDHLAEKELGLKYEDIDLVLSAHLDLGISETNISEYTGLNQKIVEKVLKMYRASDHKRKPLSSSIQLILDSIRFLIIKNIRTK